MEDLTTAEAAELAGISVRQFHGYAGTLGIPAARKLPGRRGVKFWRLADARRVKAHAEEIAAERAAS